MRQDEEVYTTEEVAVKLRVTPKTVREWIQRGELKAIDTGQGYRIFKSDYEEFLENRRRRKERKK
jgi:excisionase family DNA binding protein